MQQSTQNNMPERTKANYLGISTQFNLDIVCRPLVAAGYQPYLVGSCLFRPDYRDVDIRVMLPDEEYDQLFDTRDISHPRLKVFNTAISCWLESLTNKPIDFQFQRRTDANEQFDGERQPLGMTLERGEQRRKYKLASDPIIDGKLLNIKNKLTAAGNETSWDMVEEARNIVVDLLNRYKQG